jgi:hypothetical protein
MEWMIEHKPIYEISTSTVNLPNWAFGPMNATGFYYGRPVEYEFTREGRLALRPIDSLPAGQPAYGWKCHYCGLRNNEPNPRCEGCNAPRR